MGKKGKVGKNRQDKFYHLAKEHGFRSRASFKLVQLNKRHDFLSPAARGVIDLCAAPGGWMQVARKHIPLHAPCVGVDLVPIRPVPGCVGLVGDITADATKTQLRHALRQAGAADKVDVVLNDGSPNMGKAWLHDAYTQSELTLAALKLAAEFLAPGGTFVTKVFRSNDYNSLLFVMNQLFARVTATKPSASRAESAEIYVMCSHYHAPKTIDPRLLNPKFVFKDLASAPDTTEKPDLFLNTVMKSMKAGKRNRGGYQDGDLTLFNRVSVLQFCRTSRPVAMMVEASQISLDARDVPPDTSPDDASKIVQLIHAMPETTDDVKHCLEDLKLLARRDFKLILKWRSAARQKLLQQGLLESSAKPATQPPHVGRTEEGEDAHVDASAGSDATAQDDDDDDISSDEERLSEEMKKARAERLAKEKRKRRKLNKAHSATQRKIDMKIILPEEQGGDRRGDPHGLFSIKSAASVLDKVASVDGTPVVAAANDCEDGYDPETDSAALGSRIQYQVKENNHERNETMEEDLDRWYKVYLTRKKRDKNGALLETKEKKRMTKRRALREALEAEGADGQGSERPKLTVDSSESSESEVDPDGGVTPHSSTSREAALWFTQPVFQGMDESSEEEDVPAKGHDSPDDAAVENGHSDFHKAAMNEATVIAEKADHQKQSSGADFDVVPMVDAARDEVPTSDDDTESFHSSDYDTDEKAELVAIGRKMRQSRKVASEILDEGYHRYTFEDPDDLPRWFADPDPAFRRRQPPVTKEQVSEMKEYIKSLQSAPTKKEAEAKARRRARLAKKMEAVKAKATNIAEQGDVPASSRMKAIEDLYKQAMKSGKSGKKNKRKVYQVVRPNGRMAVGKSIGKGRKATRGVRTTLVDRRLKADKRGLAKAQKQVGKHGGRKS